ncbi:MAG TPA: hypothetical protein VNF00_02420 [Candidatus Acidoferrales bacterium]|nr:hypothetical protein [Candidatus Acidoferrales bacterium]
MSASKRLLIIGGLALGIWAMGFGLYYAVFIEHQTLDQIASSLTSGFTFAAQRRLPEARTALAASAQGTYVYVRQVDAHGHWIGLAMLLIVLGAAFDRVGFEERLRFILALGLFAGAVIFPLGVLLETLSRGGAPKFLAIAGSALIIFSLAGIAAGFARTSDP